MRIAEEGTSNKDPYFTSPSGNAMDRGDAYNTPVQMRELQHALHEKPAKNFSPFPELYSPVAKPSQGIFDSAEEVVVREVTCVEDEAGDSISRMDPAIKIAPPSQSSAPLQRTPKKPVVASGPQVHELKTEVYCPSAASPGDVLQVKGPNGANVFAEVPGGVMPGQYFTVVLPPEPEQRSTQSVISPEQLSHEDVMNLLK
jgi:hypothetical protein